MDGSARCIITGCRLVDYARERTLWGDLHLLGDEYRGVLVFNGVQKRNGTADWKYHERTREERELWIYDYAQIEMCESRGVVVIPLQPGVTLNKPAFDHILKYHPQLANYLRPQR